MTPEVRLALSTASGLLRRLIAPDTSQEERAALTAALQPQEADYARAFLPPGDEQARRAYPGLWALRPAPVIAPDLGQTELRLAAARASDLAGDAAAAFPGGYQRIASLLVPDLVWIAWQFVAPGESAGLQFDGLCYLPEAARLAWFPKPWRALAAALPAGPA